MVSWPISCYGESVLLSFKPRRLKTGGNGLKNGKMEMQVIWWIRWKNWGTWNVSALCGATERASGGSGGSRVPLPSAEPTRTGGLWWQPRQVLTRKAHSPQPAVTFSPERKLAREYGWDDFMIIHKSCSDVLNPLMRWFCDKIAVRQLTLSRWFFGGEERSCLEERLLTAAFLSHLIFCSSAERSWTEKPDSSCGCTFFYRTS